LNARNVIRAGTLGILAAALGVPVVAAAVQGAGEKTVHERISESVRRINPGLNVDEVSETPIEGVREVLIGGQVFYFSEDGRYMLQGELVDLQERRSLTEQRREGLRAAALSKFDEKDLLIYPAKGQRKHAITVVTDIDCPYCRRFHQHMAEMNDLGIEVRYLLMPRAGVGSESYVKAVNVWCADRPQEAMTAAKRGEKISGKKCDHLVDRHMAIAEQMGINATPTTITQTGVALPGYMPPNELLAKLEEARRKTGE
jgi:thiol:disulfide interchange protein DsbC